MWGSSCLVHFAATVLSLAQGAAGMSTSELLFYNAATSLPLLLLIVLATGEASAAPALYNTLLIQIGHTRIWATLLSCSLMVRGGHFVHELCDLLRTQHFRPRLAHYHSMCARAMYLIVWPRACCVLACISPNPSLPSFLHLSQGVLLNYCLFLCTTANSALTTTIVGVLKGVVAVFLGFFLLGGVAFSWLNVSGIALNTLGGVWYTAIK